MHVFHRETLYVRRGIIFQLGSSYLCFIAGHMSGGGDKIVQVGWFCLRFIGEHCRRGQYFG